MITISTDELKKLIDKKEKFCLIDVREKDELKYGMIPCAFNIPLSELEKAIQLDPDLFKKKYNCEKFKKTDRVIVYCRTGGRSSHAANYLRNLGYTVENYAGSVQEWSKKDKNVKMY